MAGVCSGFAVKEKTKRTMILLKEVLPMIR